MNKKKAPYFPKYFWPQQEPSSEEGTLKWRTQWQIVYIYIKIGRENKRKMNLRKRKNLQEARKKNSILVIQWGFFKFKKKWFYNDLFIRTHTKTRTHIYIYIYNTHTHTHVCTHTYTHAHKYIYIYIIIIALSQILSTLQIISHLVRHEPTKWINDNQHCYNTHIYIYIYIYIYICVCVCVCVCVAWNNFMLLFQENKPLRYYRNHNNRKIGTI